MPTVRLGNTAPVEVHTVDEETGERSRSRASIDNGYGHDNTVTTFQVPLGVGLVEALRTVTDTYDQYHSDDPPEWVESDPPELADVLASHYSQEGHECVVGKPSGWEGLDPLDGEALTAPEPTDEEE